MDNARELAERFLWPKGRIEFPSVDEAEEMITKFAKKNHEDLLKNFEDSFFRKLHEKGKEYNSDSRFDIVFSYKDICEIFQLVNSKK